jgi:hypothetical protein
MGELIEAWSRWFGGDPSLPDSYLWGLKIVWWGRLGKLFAFLGALTIVLDIIGADKLNRMVLSEDGHIRRVYLVLSGLAVAMSIVWAAVTHPYSDDEFPMEASTNPWVVLVVVVGITLTVVIWKALMWVFAHGRVANVVRIACLLFILVGFHFDLLAS